MTDESAFQDSLDELAIQLRPSRALPPSRAELLDRYFGTCAVFADWLEEQGDWRAAGYRWISQYRKVPRCAVSTWEWWRFGESGSATTEDLPTAVWNRLPCTKDQALHTCKGYSTRRDAEWALCKAINSLEADK